MTIKQNESTVVVYILISHTLDKFYIGQTSDLPLRLKEHSGKYYNKAFTKKGTDWELFLSFQCKNRTQARKIESHIKKMKSKKYISNLKLYPELIAKLLLKYSS